MKKIIISVFAVAVILHLIGVEVEKFEKVEALNETYKPIEYRSVMQSVLKEKYDWYSDRIFDAVYNELKKYYAKDSFDFYKMVGLVHALINAESNGRVRATGPKVSVLIYRNNVLVRENHRARGLMQVMSFHADHLKPRQLYKVENNIEHGVRVLLDGMKKAKGSIRIALKNYNSGINSSYYNEPYIKEITQNYQETFSEWMRQKEQSYIVLLD